VPTLELANLLETAVFGKRLGELARAGDIITLSGELGAGKTTLTQYIGKGLLVPDSCYITSPTFSLMHEYPGRIPLYHFDLYRLSEEEIADLGFEDYLYGSGLSVIEWSERLGTMMPEERLHIELQYWGTEGRKAHISGYGRQLAKINSLF
jgi:tRNA threonylcarbamoyladenosine biosynthesis protein TsaE